LEIAPEVLRTVAAKIGPKIDEMIDNFATKLDAWVVTAGEELHREVLEVLKATQDARAAGDQTAAQIQEELSAQAKQLGAAETRIEELRKDLWTPKETASTPALSPSLDAPGSGA
jgi:hypothetical protein